MNISNCIHTTFGKQLVAKCQIGEKGNRQCASIYLLDKKTDHKILENAKDDYRWSDNYYLGGIANDFYINFKHSKHYIMENKEGNLICVALTRNEGGNTKLQYIETAPKMSFNNGIARRMKYIGETMVSFLVKNAEEKKKPLEVPCVAIRPKTENFYFQQCKFERKGQHGAFIPKNNVQELLEQNQKHTGSAVNIVG